jgi:uncharacterized protein (PEP-CTERM system associated)
MMSLNSLLTKTSIFVVLLTITAQAQDLTAASTPKSGFLSSPSDSNNDITNMDSMPSIKPLTDKKMRRFKISPYGAATATYSDNVGLNSDSSPLKESGMIYSTDVGVNAAYESQKLDAVAGVGLTRIWRDNDSADTIPTAQAGVSTELINNLLYLDALGSIQGLRQNAYASIAPSGASNSDFETYLQTSVSPYLRHQFGNLAVGELRYGYDYGGGTGDSAGTIQSHTYKASFGTANNSGRLNVNGSTSYTDLSYKDQLGGSNDSTQLTPEITATYALTKKLTGIGQVGYDEVDMTDTSYAKDLSGAFYNAGLQYVPSERARVTGRYGKRHSSQYYALDGNYNLTKRVYVGATAMSQLLTAIPLGYRGNATPGTAFDAAVEGQTLASKLDDVLPGGNSSKNVGQTVLGNQQNTQLYMSRSVTAYLGMALQNGDTGLALGYEKRDYNIASDEVIKTATAHYRHDFTRKFSGTIEGFYYGLDGLIVNTNDTYGGRLLGNYALNDTVNLFASVGRTERTADFSDAEFTEHNISAGVSAQF